MSAPRVTLLGTGVPLPDPRRRGPAQVIEAGGGLVLVDCGAGALHRLLEAGYALGSISRIALTHLHSDHITGIADLLWAGWITRAWREPPPVIGPPGTREFLAKLFDAFAYDIRVRTLGVGHRREALEPAVTEIEDGFRFETGGWRLTAFRVDHAPVDEAFGYRLDTDGGSVVVSGDTRRSENLSRHARGADLLIHEVIWRTGMERRISAAPNEEAKGWSRAILDYHTPAEEVGDVAARAEVVRLVLSHLVLAGGTPDDLVRDVRTTWNGPLTVGEDLMVVGGG